MKAREVKREKLAKRYAHKREEIAAKVKSGSAQPNRDKVGQVTWDQVREIAQDKMSDMNCFTIEAAMRMIAGTARSMGINVVGEFPNK